jgi:hypothetical protein
MFETKHNLVPHTDDNITTSSVIQKPGDAFIKRKIGLPEANANKLSWLIAVKWV